MKIDTNGVTLDVQVEGDGQPVVLIHGFPDSKRLWSKVVPGLLDAGFQVIVPDMRGYGASSKPPEADAYSIPMLAIDIVGILDHLELERAHVVGHDWGAAAAWAVGTFAPDRVDHLVALSVGHPSGFLTTMEQREKSWYMLLFQYVGLAEDWLTRDNWANFREWSHHPDVDAVIAELERDQSLTTGLNYYRATITPEAVTGPPLELPPIQAPTMAVWSSHDFALVESGVSGSDKFVDNTFRYERIEGVGHWMQWEAPDKVTALLVDFLSH
jgi:pimeloyl-ACP methyl ester carboxylesterase